MPLAQEVEPDADPLETMSLAQLETLSLTDPAEPMSPAQNLGTLAYPPEIILMITKYLDNVSVLALAITCRYLYQTCFPSSASSPPLDLNPDEKKDLLVRLERDMPHFYFCPSCVKLHTWHESWFSHNDDGYYNDIDPLDCKSNAKYWSGIHSFNIPYRLLRVVMNRHLYSAAHGVPADTLQTRITYPVGACMYSASFDARVIDGQLFASCTSTLRNETGSACSLRAYLSYAYKHICSHISVRDIPPLFPEVHAKSPGGESVVFCGEFFKPCHECMTDYQVDVDLNGKQDGWIIKVVTWKKLGTARWPFHGAIYHPTRCYQESPECQPGAVRHAWSKADAVVFKAEDTWGEKPECGGCRNRIRRAFVARYRR